MARRRVMLAVLGFLTVCVLFWVSSLLVNDKKDTLSRHLSLLVHVGQTASRNYDTSLREQWKTRGPDCTPQTNVVFIKTHKTASSTTSSIFDHFAYNNNLIVAVPQEKTPYMDRKELFNRGMVAKTHEAGIGWRREDGFNMLTVHARYNRPEMDAVVHDAKFITVIRDPRSQFVSSFVYFNFVERFQRIFDSRGEKNANVIAGFLENPWNNYDMMRHRTFSQVLWNQQMFDLGFDETNFTDMGLVDRGISRLAREIDLVMITEYYDESLLLLRKLLCWDMDDIVYSQRLVRNSSQEITVDDATREKIGNWNAADTRLYDHFNRTLWQHIAAYGPSFQDDLRTFRRKLSETSRRNTGKHSRDTRKIMKRMKDRGILAR